MDYHILLVEDSPAARYLTRYIYRLLARSRKLHEVTDGEAALEFLYKREPYQHAPIPDIVLLDLNLPGIGGLETLRRVRSDPQISSIPIVVLSGSEEEADIAAAYSHGANSYAHKPMSFEGMQDLLRRIDDYWLEGRCVLLPGRNNKKHAASAS
jgi:two-component system, chemotaxis family, response regulator Rcp1